MDYQQIIDKLTDKDIMHLSTHKIPTYLKDGEYNPEFIKYLNNKREIEHDR